MSHSPVADIPSVDGAQSPVSAQPSAPSKPTRSLSAAKPNK